jgi:hypothetical protein
MKRNLLLIQLLLLIAFSSCSQSEKEIYKTKSGNYASKPGNFIVYFPTEPKLTVIDNKIGTDEFKIKHFRSTLGADKIFSLEYFDYPDYLLKNRETDNILSESVKNMSNKLGDKFYLTQEKFLTQKGIRGKYFVSELKNEFVEKGIEGYAEGIIFLEKNRIYTQMFMGVDNNHTIDFIKSFRTIE